MAHETHEVTNQPPPFPETNLFTSDRVLGEALRREGAEWAEPRLTAFGKAVGSREAVAWGFQANENSPILRTHDRFGNRIDEVEFHPAWHEIMRLSIAHAAHSLSWTERRPGAHVARAALGMLASQNESGHLCPLSMAHASIPVLRMEPEIAAVWEGKVLSTKYDSNGRPPGEKTGVLIGMFLTEKQGGSDVRANTTRAVPVRGLEYSLTGHKWFCSAIMCDAFLVTAQAQKGLTCFLLPRWTPEGKRNAFHLQRLKDKMGNRSNATAEVEIDGALAWRVGEEGRGIPTIMEMVTHTRLDCAIGSVANMRQALVQALHHTAHRAAFGRKLADQPMMRNVLADLCIESEAATALMMRMARAFDRRDEEDPFLRLATPVGKYWICKRAPAFVGEAMECLGGSGYIEESILPRLYRETPVNSLWEGSGSVICLDALRAMTKEPECVDAFRAEVRLASDHRVRTYLDRLDADLARPEESGLRRLIERMALALQASLLVRHSPPAVADAFCASRLAGDSGVAYGTLAGGTDFRAILERAAPR